MIRPRVVWIDAILGVLEVFGINVKFVLSKGAKRQFTNELTHEFCACVFSEGRIVELHVESSQVVCCDAVISEGCFSKTNASLKTKIDRVREVVVRSEQKVQTKIPSALLVLQLPNDKIFRLTYIVDFTC